MSPHRPAGPILTELALARSTLDRAAHRRTEPGLIPALLADPSTHVLPVADGTAPVFRDGDRPRLRTVPGPDWSGPAPVVFLGVDEVGAAWLAAPVDDPALVKDRELGLGRAEWSGLRQVGAGLDDTGAGVLVTAVALLAWHATHLRCPRCGRLTDVVHAGWVRRCGTDGSEHYPRTDPAVIMAVVDADDRILLGRQGVWPEGRFSTLAGFVEPGESLETAVRREVLEESGVVVGDVTYLGSQPWPFPASLMLGFRGEARSTDVTPDGTELAEARWWARDELVEALAAGDLMLPGGVSIARRLIEDWFGGPVTDGPRLWA